MLFGLTEQVTVIDLETSSSADLKKCGSYAYFADPSTTVLIAGFERDGPDDVVDWETRHTSSPLEKILRLRAAEPPEVSMFAAFNAAFENGSTARCFRSDASFGMPERETSRPTVGLTIRQFPAPSRYEIT